MFRARFFKDTDEIVSILVSAIDRETAAMRRIMKEVQWLKTVFFYNQLLDCVESDLFGCLPVWSCMTDTVSLLARSAL